ncbi:MAG: hypothetical protein NC320_12165 [Clostridium sp.]|nr:hypothetical protein [Clostridium sp.]
MLTDDRNSLRLYAGRGDLSSEILVDKKEKFKSYLNEDEQVTHKGTLVFDYAELAEPISDYISGYNWFVRLNGNHNSASFKITDNLSNTKMIKTKTLNRPLAKLRKK